MSLIPGSNHWDPIQGVVPAHFDDPAPLQDPSGRLGTLSLIACAAAFVVFVGLGSLLNYLESPYANYAAFAGLILLFLGFYGAARYIKSPEARQTMCKHHIIAQVGRQLGASCHLFTPEPVSVQMAMGRIIPTSLEDVTAQSFQDRGIGMTVSPAQIAHILLNDRAPAGNLNPLMALDIDDPFEFDIRTALPAFTGTVGISPVNASPYPPQGILWWQDGTRNRWIALGIDSPSFVNPHAETWPAFAQHGAASARCIIALQIPFDIKVQTALMLQTNGLSRLKRDPDVPFERIFAQRGAAPVPIPAAVQTEMKQMAHRYGAEFYLSGATLFIRSCLPLPKIEAAESADAAADVLVAAIGTLYSDGDHLAALFTVE